MTEITSLSFVKGKDTIVTRSLEGEIKLWDLRNIKQPLATRTDINTVYDGTEIVTDPNHKFILAGITGDREHGGDLLFMDSDTLETKRELHYSNGSVISILWHNKLNQV